MLTSLRALVEAEYRSRHEGEPPLDIMREDWVPQFLDIILDNPVEPALFYCVWTEEREEA